MSQTADVLPEQAETPESSDTIVSIESVQFPGVFLRMDSKKGKSFAESGFGIVNCQYGAREWEQFRIRTNDNGTVSIESVQFPGVFLRMDSKKGKSFAEPGFGIVNCQYGAREWEQFHIRAQFVRGLTRVELDEIIRTYGPIVRLHENESYRLCNVEELLTHSRLHDKTTGKDVVHPTPAQLPTGTKNDGRYWLIIDDTFKAGDLPNARAYVHALWRPGVPYTDIQFFFLYAYNGPGTVHVSTAVHEGNADVAPLGEHYGDWETFMLRVDNATKVPIGAWFSQHDGGEMIGRSQMASLERDGTRVITYASLNGHAMYAHPGPNPTYRKVPPVLHAFLDFYLRNDTSKKGSEFDASRNYEIVSADWLGVHEPRWLDYPYRWGPEGAGTHATPEMIAKVVFAALGWLSFIITAALGAMLAGLIIDMFITDDLNGPEGPKTKDQWDGKYS